jgi:Tfp pilus assembly PilM family ATPase
MAKKENTILSIDIGGDSLKMAEFMIFPDGGGMRLLRFDVREYNDEQREMTLDQSFSEIFPAMLSENHFVSTDVMVSISGQVAFSRLSKLPPRGDDKSNIRRVIDFEAKQIIPYPMNEVIWDSQLVVRNIEAEQQDAEPEDPENPVAPEEPAAPKTTEEIEALIVAVKKDLLTDIAELIEDHGKKVVAIEIAATASYNAARAIQLGEQGCDMILNIGGRCSSLIFVDHSRIFIRVIPIAGFMITQQIAKEFNISNPEAEELKRRHGFVALGGAYEEPESEVAATISKIARNVMTKLHGEINRTITMWRSQNGGTRPRRAFLAGGGSLMEYTNRFFEEKLRIPVDYLNPFTVLDIDQDVDKNRLNTVAPMFSELIGSALQAATNCPVEINLLPDSIKGRRAFQRKKPYLYISCVTVIFCLLVFYFGVGQRLDIDKTKVQRAESAVKNTEKMVKAVQGLRRDFEDLKGQYDSALGVIKKRTVIPGRFNELQKAIPDSMWLSSVKLFNTATEVQQQKSGTSFDPGDPWAGMGGGGFGGEQKPAESKDYDALKLVGHSLVMREDILNEAAFMEKLLKTTVFQNSDDAVGYVDKYFIGPKGKDNVTSFKIKIKLKNPVKM